MKQYALKLSRDTATRNVQVHPVTIAPPGAKPYRLRRPRPYYAESLQLFKTRKEAEAARAAELTAAEFSLKPDVELKKILRRDLAAAAKFGITLATLCRITGESYHRLVEYLSRGRSPNPRVVARFHILAEEFARVAKSGESLLPASGGCGNPRQGRGGRPDIWMDQERYKPKKNSKTGPIIAPKPIDIRFRKGYIKKGSTHKEPKDVQMP